MEDVERPDGMPPAVLEDRMVEMCVHKDLKGNDAYPSVDERTARELDDGTIVYATIKLGAGEAAVSYAVPGAIATETNADETTSKVVNFFNSNVWKHVGVDAVKHVGIESCYELRYGIVPGPSQSLVTPFLELLPGEQTADMANRCIEELYETHKNFRDTCEASKDKHQEFVPGPSSEWPRAVFLKRCLTACLQEGDMTPQAWTSRALNPSELPEELTTAFKTDIFTPTLEEMTSGNTDQAKVKAFVTAMGQAATNAKYLCMAMDIVVCECAAIKVPAAAKGANGASGAADGGVNTHVPKGLPAARELKQLHGKVDALTVAIELLGTQLKLRTVIATQQVELKATTIKVPGDHRCGYTVLQALAHKAKDPAALLSLTLEGAQQAIATICAQANVMWLADAPKFKNATECDSYDEYLAKMIRSPSTLNWKGSPEGLFFVAGNMDLEVRTLYIDDKGKVQMESTLQDGEKPRKHVGFSIYTGSNHHDIGATHKEGQPAGDLQYVFTPAEATTAQRLLSEYLTASKEKKSVSFTLNTSGDQSANQSVEDVEKRVLELLADEDSKEGTAWQTVNSNDKKQRKKEKKKAQVTEGQKSNGKGGQTGWGQTVQQQQGQQAAQQQAQQAAQQQQAQQAAQQQQAQQAARQQLAQQAARQQLAQQAAQHQQAQQAVQQQAQQAAQQQQSQQAAQLQQAQAAAAWQQQHAQQASVTWQQQAGQVMQQHQSHQELQQGMSYGPPTGKQHEGQGLQQQQPPAWPTQRVHQVPFQQQQDWQVNTPPTTSQWGGQKAVQVDGDHIVPAVVVFGPGTKEDLQVFLKGVEPTAASAIASIQQVTTGTPRCVLHCKQSQSPLVQSLISPLHQHNISAAIYKSHTPPPGKAQQATAGLNKAADVAGLCRYYANHQACPHSKKTRGCSFRCWNGPPENRNPS
jgi:hypothetical protein